MAKTPAPTVALLATLDTKGEEAHFVRECIERAGLRVSMIDVGVQSVPQLAAEVTGEAVARRAGASIAALRRDNDRAAALDAMIRGAEIVVLELFQRQEISGVIALGGSGGTAIGTAAMRQLPLGVPKVMVSTIASGDTVPYVGGKDICMVNAVVDFSGVNRVSRPILRNAAGALCGMFLSPEAPAISSPEENDVPLVASSMFGVTTPCVNKSRALLVESGLQLIPFHATGIGGRTMESLIAEGLFAAVLDITTTEWADEVVGGTLSAGPTRLEAAARAGLPQVIAPGALDMVNFVGAAGLPQRFHGRIVHRHNENVILMRTTAAECAEIGRRIAEKLNQAQGPTTVVFPLGGLSALDAPGAAFHDPHAGQSLLEALRTHCEPSVRLVTVDAHINDDAFARVCVDELLANMLHAKSRQSTSSSN